VKPETKVWLRCESVGKPANTLEMQTSVREAVKSIAQWLMGVYMGSKIRITLAREQHELGDSAKSIKTSDLMGELESLLGGTPEQEQHDGPA